ncbi:C-GCAxxG-C-C family (seleno)protein [Sporomusa acidovorans]|uniref:Redox-active protein n=1 Tax=Sporomusa acidovorans (strain ATCC 49682 / DSM 3132 / Mol) TaxID=1123286 RepID=A0ABZ3J3Z6_SPOA4|nr:C-GCAxxG-C-C family (seleno)protein [Sporomusa acidovorans]OZC15472.1 putative redox-active protein [Sporomusa acidovorans DSM 3132]SDE15626.1 C_GCAxxG_C_C family probable redox protein [Sporomusa acidovorans]
MSEQNQKETAKDLAGQYFKEGYNCAESVVRAFRDFYKLDVSDEALRMASGFGGGLGHAGCMCGALSGATMVLGMLQGRVNKEQSRGPVYGSAHEFHEVFTKQFGAACCRILNPHEFGSQEQRRTCLKITSTTAGILLKYLEDKQLLPTNN